MNNCIGIYDNALSSKKCKELIEYFERKDVIKKPGTFDYNGEGIVDENIKKSIEMPVRFGKDGDRTIVSETIQSILFPYIEKYWKKYIKPSLEFDDLILDYNYAFKKLEGNDAGFKVWHTEQTGGIPNRVLVWMVYLNNAKSGTDFLYTNNIKAKEGRLIIWPASFTHTHRSQKNKGLKYIVSGWITLNGNGISMLDLEYDLIKKSLTYT